MVVVVGVMDREMATCVLVSGGGCWCYGQRNGDLCVS